VPSGLIDEDDGMGATRDNRRYFLQMKVHGGGVAPWQDQGRADAARRADCAEDIGRAGALILRRRGARSAFRPAPCDLVLLSDPGLVLKPNLYSRARGERGTDLRHSVRKVFLKAAAAAGSWA